MSKQEIYENMCKKCYVRIMKPSKKEIKNAVMSDENVRCDCCGRVTQIVEYIEE